MTLTTADLYEAIATVTVAKVKVEQELEAVHRELALAQAHAGILQGRITQLEEDLRAVQAATQAAAQRPEDPPLLDQPRAYPEF